MIDRMAYLAGAESDKSRKAHDSLARDVENNLKIVEDLGRQ